MNRLFASRARSRPLRAWFHRARKPPEPLPLIFDTDICGDCDDVLALAMIHAFQTRGDCRLLAVTVGAITNSPRRWWRRAKHVLRSRRDPDRRRGAGGIRREKQVPRRREPSAERPLSLSACARIRQVGPYRDEVCYARRSPASPTIPS